MLLYLYHYKVVILQATFSATSLFSPFLLNSLNLMVSIFMVIIAVAIILFISNSKVLTLNEKIVLIGLVILITACVIVSINDYTIEMPLPGIRCPHCLAHGKEVWVIPGRACGESGTPVM